MPELRYATFRVNDAGGIENAKLDPGETASLSLLLRSAGSAVGPTSARLIAPAGELVVLDGDGSFVVCAAGDTVGSGPDDFRVTAPAGAAVEVPVWCSLVLEGAGYSDTVAVPILIGDSMNLPAGPDPGGYRIYDWTDSAFVERAAYDWVELRGIGEEVVLGNDETRALALPADFGAWRWYGVDYDSISICSNGWVAAGVTDRPDFVNIVLPYEGSPPNILALCWSDLDPEMGGHIWYRHDKANHRFIIEYDSVPSFRSTGPADKVQVHIYDRTVPTLTGDNRVTVHFNTVGSLRYATVGFQNQDGTAGLTHVWNELSPRVAAPLRPERALAIQTGLPTGVEESGEPPAAGRRVPALRLSPNPCRAGTPVTVRWQPAPTLSAPASLSVSDVAGRIACIRPLDPGMSGITLSALPSGLYFLTARSGLHTVTSKLLITD